MQKSVAAANLKSPIPNGLQQRSIPPLYTGRLPDERVAWAPSLPFILLHVAALSVFFVPFSWYLPLLALGSYYFRMLSITIGFHRYFSHKTFKTSRPMQFLLAFASMTSVQKGVLWWAAHHRHHHRHSDQHDDIHSPAVKGFFWSQIGWILCRKYDETRYELIPDLAKYPELRWLNRYHLVPPVAYAALLFAIWGWPGVAWGFFASTVMLFHCTSFINSLTHVFGKRVYETSDTSRNSFILAIICCGEGWHNNHHYYQGTANQGWHWWQVDFSYYALKVLAAFRLVWDLRTPPAHIVAKTIASKC